MKFVVYLQVDARYCDYLLREINHKTVIENTLERIKMIGNYKIISSIFQCEENRKIYQILESNDVECSWSLDSNVTTRFYDAIVKCEDIDAVIRVCGDQVLLDTKLSRQIVDSFKGYDYFYHSDAVGAVIPDIVRIEVLRNNKENITTSKRYFEPLIKDTKLKRLIIELRHLIFLYRTNNKLSYQVCKIIIENNLDIYLLQDNLIDELSGKCYMVENGMIPSWILANRFDSFFYDNTGECNPWWCESAVNFVRKKIEGKELSVFEWGAGNSTLFWSNYAKKVVSIEHDIEWYKKLVSLVPSNVSLKYIELEYDGDYCRAMEDEEEFDIVSIDGRDRVRCAKNCLSHLKKSGIIIWDNTDRKNYEEGITYLLNKGFRMIEFSGIVWGAPGKEDYTAIFYRNDNMWNL